MSKRKRRLLRCPRRDRRDQVDPQFWSDELERILNRFGASTCDLPELDPESCQTKKQHEHAVRVRARFMSRQIREVEQQADGEEADCLFAHLMERACLLDDGPAWFAIEKASRRGQSGPSPQYPR